MVITPQYMGFGVRVTYQLGSTSNHARAPLGVQEEIHNDSRLSIAAERPSWYPLRVLRKGHLLLVVEGHLYGNWQPALETVRDLSQPLDDGLVDSLRSCSAAHDGEAALILYDSARERMVVCGDLLGRLPVYYHITDTHVVVSRSQRFIIDNISRRTVDVAALSQLLLLGYPLEASTLTASVSRLLPGDLLVIKPSGAVLHGSRRSAFRRQYTGSPKSFRQAVSDLRDEFSAACRVRSLVDYSHVLSLSGGIDSRTTGAGMRSVLDRFSAVTFVAPGSLHADESDVAEVVARVLDTDWRSYEFHHDAPDDINAIIQLKVGLNPIDVAFGIDYVKRVQRDFGGKVAFWTGEGADKLLCEHRPIPARPNLGQLVSFIVEKNAILKPDAVARLCGVSRNDLFEHIYNAVKPHDDIEPEDSYVHFLLTQRVVRWHTEGEDRHRVAVWPISPFFGVRFFALARSVPPAWKRGRRLYRAFLSSLAPDIASIKLTGGHAPPASRRFLFDYTVRELVRGSKSASRAYANLRRWRHQHALPTPWHLRLQALLSARAVPQCLDSEYLARLIASGKLDSRSAAQILTVVLAVNSLSTADGTQSRSHVDHDNH